MEVGAKLHLPTVLSPRKNPGTKWIWSSVGPRPGLDALVKKEKSFLLSSIELRIFQPVA